MVSRVAGVLTALLSALGIGGGIGIGLFLGAGAALAKAGPVGILLAYILVGALLWTVMISLGSSATLLSAVLN